MGFLFMCNRLFLFGYEGFKGNGNVFAYSLLSVAESSITRLTN